LASPYAVTKYVNKLYADVFGKTYGLQSIGLRYFNVFGPRQDPNGAYAAVIPKWISSMIKNEPIYINGDGETSRDFCFVNNAVQANLLAATVPDESVIAENATIQTTPSPVNQVYNVAVGDRTTLNELYAQLKINLSPFTRTCKMPNPFIVTFAPVMCATAWPISARHSVLGYAPLNGSTRVCRWPCLGTWSKKTIMLPSCPYPERSSS